MKKSSTSGPIGLGRGGGITRSASTTSSEEELSGFGSDSIKLNPEDVQKLTLADEPEQREEDKIGDIILDQKSFESDENVGRLLGSSVLPHKPKPGSEGKAVGIKVNMKKLCIPNDQTVYRYEVHIKASNPLTAKYKEVTKGALDDYERMEKRNICWDVYVAAVTKYREHFPMPYGQVYDRNKQLFSLRKLHVPFEIKKVQVDKGEFDMSVSLPCDLQMVVKVGDLDPVICQDLAMRDRLQQQFLELATSQQLYKKNEYLAYGGNFYHKGDTINLGAGRFMAQGFGKRVRVVEGDGEPMTTLQVDIKKTAIFKNIEVTELVKELLEIRNGGALLKQLNIHQRKILSIQLKSLRVVTTHREKNTDFLVSEVTKHAACDQEITIGDTTLTVAQHFANTYGALKYPNLPCLVNAVFRDKQVVKNYYPIEVCRVLPHQRVPVHKQTENQQREMIAKTSILPQNRLREIDLEERKAGLIDSNKFLAGLQLSVDHEMMNVEGRVLPHLRILYDQQSSPVNVSTKGSWDMMANQKWFIGGRCGSHAVVLVDEKSEEAMMQMQTFMDMFYKRAEQTGITFGDQLFANTVDMEALNEFFEIAVGREVQFVLLVLQNKDDSIKNMIKYYEQKHSVLTQCLLRSTVRSVVQGERKGVMTLLNILAKTNMKLGGLNYVIEPHAKIMDKYLSDDVMLMGCDVNHPPPLRRDLIRKGIEPLEPSVVGMVATTQNAKLMMTMDYLFQNPRREEVDSIELLTQEMLRRYQRSHEGKLPKRVIFYRDGVAEGQFQMVLTKEIPGMEEAFHEVGGSKYNPALTVVICQKRHYTRLFMENMVGKKASDQNIPPGTVVDKKVVHPTNWEFYLCSHLASQGTARCVKYTVVRDDNEFSSDDLQGLTFLLSHGHQIVTKTVSLPAPVMAAHDAAARGKKVWKAFMSKDDASSLSSGQTELPNWLDVSSQLRANHILTDKAYWA